MQEQAQSLIAWMRANETISKPAKPLARKKARPITLADLIEAHPGKALSLLGLAALALLALIGN